MIQNRIQFVSPGPKTADSNCPRLCFLLSSTAHQTQPQAGRDWPPQEGQALLDTYKRTIWRATPCHGVAASAKTGPAEPHEDVLKQKRARRAFKSVRGFGPRADELNPILNHDMIPPYMNTVIRFIRRHYWWLAPLLVADILFFRWLYLRDPEPRDVAFVPPPARRTVALRPFYGYPTAQTNLAATNDAAVYMPTASGRVQSALYGSVRTVQRGGRLLPRFHAGIDIAPLRRNRSGAPRDKVMAVRDGRVVYANPVGGNSSYGIYVVLAHEDRVGEIYTLYAHLADIADELEIGSHVTRGQNLGRMGNSASTGIPMVRAHLHFEIGVFYNRHFEAWGRERHDGLNHGVGHGWNLSPIDPLAVYGGGETMPRFCMATHLESLEPAFVLVFASAMRPEYFERYPLLWRGDERSFEAITMAVSEAGTPLWGRPATEAERETISRGQSAWVIDVDESVLGRNGMRLIVSSGGDWQLSGGGDRWLDIITWDGG